MTVGTKAQYAAHRGCSPAYLSKKDVAAMLAPALVPDTEGGKPKIDFEKADELFRANLDPARQRMNERKPAAARPPDDGARFGDVKTRRELVKLEEDTLRLSKQKGETLYRKDVTDACALAGQVIQEQMKSVSLRLAEKFSTMTDVRAIKTAMDEEIRKIFETISDDLTRKFANPGEGGDTAH